MASSVVGNYQYWLRLSVVNDVCVKEALLDILHDPLTGGLPRNKQQLFVVLYSFKKNKKHVWTGHIKPFQWQILCHACDGGCANPCPKSGQTDSNDLDITCIVVLIIHLTTLPPPLGKKGWKQIIPLQADNSKAAFVLLAKNLRNFLAHCCLGKLQTQKDFVAMWTRMEDIVKGLGYKNMVLFVHMKTISLDPYITHQVACLQNRITNIDYTKCDKTEMAIVKVEIDSIKYLIAQLEQQIKSCKKHNYQIVQHDQQLTQCDLRIDVLDQRTKNIDEMINRHDEVLKQHDQFIDGFDQVFDRYDIVIERYDEKIERHDREIERHDKEIIFLKRCFGTNKEKEGKK